MKKTTKIVVSLLLTLCMLMPMSTMLVTAAEPEAKAAGDVSYYTGNATAISNAKTAILEAFNAGKPIEINSADALVAFAQQSATTKFSKATVNINTNIVINKGNAANWIVTAPAFAWPGIRDFSGTFNGNGYTISGIYCNRTADFQGFFYVLNQGTTVINDLGIVNSLFYATSGYLPAIVGRVNSQPVTFNNCYSNAITYGTGGGFAGGFASLVSNTVATFNNCVFDGVVYCKSDSAAVGGFVGRAGQYGAQEAFGAKYYNCVNRGYVYGKNTNRVGGFTGEGSLFYLENCANVGLGATVLIGDIPDYSSPNDDTHDSLAKPDINNVAIKNCYYTGNAFADTDTTDKSSTAKDKTNYKNDNDNLTYSSVTTGSGNTTEWTLPTLHEKLKDDLDYVPVANNTTVDGYNAHAFSLKYIKEYIRSATRTFNIGSADEFYALGGMLNLTGLANPNITLTNDIVLNEGNAADWATTAPAYKWSTIGGRNGSLFYFTGTLNGDGNTISGLYINQPSASGDQATGLFAVLGAGAKVENLAIVNSYVNNAKVYAGTIAGRVNGDGASISNCYVDSIVSDQNGNGDGAGIFVGFCSNTNFKITGSVAAGTVRSGNGAGGFIGMNPSYNDKTMNWIPEIADCVNFATVSGKAAGAFIGRDLNAKITRCINLGSIMSSKDTTNVLIGGVTATNASATKSNIIISDSYIFTDLNQAALGAAFQTETVALPEMQHTINVTTISKVSSVKGTKASAVLTALDFDGTHSDKADWVTRTDDYPLPAYIVENFSDVLCDTDSVDIVAFKANILKDYAGGVKTFEIDSPSTLLIVAEFLNANTFADNGLGLTFKLTNDITFNKGWDASTKTAPAQKWTPINAFRGTFDGNGHTISGLYVNETGDYIGFIKVAYANATVKDLGIINSYYKNTNSSAYMGGIIGRINAQNVNISGCYSEAIMTGAARIGGFVGLVTNTVAQTNGDPETAAKLTACVFDGTITSSGGHVGGIVATTGVYDGTKTDGTGAWHNITFVDCANYGTVEYTSTGAVSTGAIIGFIQGANNVSLTRCLNFGDVKTNSEKTDTIDGALVGRLTNNATYKVTIANCYIFTDLGQNLFDSGVIGSCNETNYSINGVTNVPSELDNPNPAPKDHITGILANKELYTIADSNTLKTSLPTGYGDTWTLRDYYSKDLKYPMPTAIYENFFQTKLVGYQVSSYKTGSMLNQKTLYSVRLIAEIDSLNYYNAGFEITATINGVTKTLNVNTNSEYVSVYKTITSNTGENYTARDGKYLITITINDLPKITDANSTFAITTFTNGAEDDSRYEAVTDTFKIDTTYTFTRVAD